ncbi:MAG: nitroreductase family protein [Armatimonadetes bacterium]|nr:nitroreductase family protein [Armatimonadota bacterium]
MPGSRPEDLLAFLAERRTVRIYRDTPVSPDLVRRLLEAATAAPSAHNAQAWRFVVIERDAVKQRLADRMADRWRRDLERSGVDPKAIEVQLRFSIRRFSTAPLLILACYTMKEMDAYPDRARRAAERTMAVQTVAVAIQNLMLAAAAYGLGSCWVCAPLFCPGLVRRALRLPADWEPQALVTVGYPAHTPPVPPRKALQDVVITR